MPPPSTLDFVLADGKPLEVQVQARAHLLNGRGDRYPSLLAGGG